MSLRDFNERALAEKARSERLYMHYALALAVLLVFGGMGLTVLGVGEHLDIVVKQGGLEARFINATPGVAATLVGVLIFAFSKPRQLKVGTSTTKTVENAQPTPRHPDSALEEFAIMSDAVRLVENGEYDALRDYMQKRQTAIMALLGRSGATSLYQRLHELIAARERSLRKHDATVTQEALRTIAANSAQPSLASKKEVTSEEVFAFYQDAGPRNDG